MLNMRSDNSQDNDRTTKARIRDAAIALFAADGVAATSVRAVAAAAGVSPGLVIHHFGSKDALRVACDQYIAAYLREQKSKAMRAGPGVDPVAALREARDGPPLLRYLARTLIDGSPHVDQMVDEMVNDAVKYLAEGVESGMLRPTAYPYERAAVLSIWSLGALVLHKHLERLIGVDLTTFQDDPTAASAYVGPVTEMLTEGLTSPDVAARIQDAFATADGARTTNEEDDGS